MKQELKRLEFTKDTELTAVVSCSYWVMLRGLLTLRTAESHCDKRKNNANTEVKDKPPRAHQSAGIKKTPSISKRFLIVF